MTSVARPSRWVTLMLTAREWLCVFTFRRISCADRNSTDAAPDGTVSASPMSIVSVSPVRSEACARSVSAAGRPSSARFGG